MLQLRSVTKKKDTDAIQAENHFSQDYITIPNR